jgi:hypothetical protein
MTDTMKQMALQTMHRLRSAADEMMLAYYTSGHVAEIHYAYALNDLRRAVEILGDRLNADTKGDADSHERAARARLIAAAPEMLAALSWFINDIDGAHTVMVDFDTNVERARAAITKAKGDAE